MKKRVLVYSLIFFIVEVGSWILWLMVDLPKAGKEKLMKKFIGAPNLPAGR